MKFFVVIAAFFASAVLVLPTVSQAQGHHISKQVHVAAISAVNGLSA